MAGDDGDEQTPGVPLLTYRLTHMRAPALTLTLPHTLSRAHPPLTSTLTQSDTQKNKMHIWGSPRRVIITSADLH